ncbi:TRAP transporter small permease [Marinibaculum pumilum]|uniref:TRAP transporter small permease protein n=1 Tax=Marinibaculum pumilum TaxID=1766165 RepID=A0ABV7L635_9PROT
MPVEPAPEAGTGQEMKVGTRMTGGLSAVERGLVALGAVSGCATLLMVLLIVPDVFLRKLLSTTVPAAAELSTQLLVLLVFLGLAGAQTRGDHFTMTAAVERMPRAARRACRLVATLASLGFAAIMAWVTAMKAWTAVLREETTIGVVSLPVWPVRIAIALGFALLALQLLLQAWRALRPDGSTA